MNRDYRFTADPLDGATRKPPIVIACNRIQIGRNDLKLH
jgi:hypothetical protein